MQGIISNSWTLLVKTRKLNSGMQLYPNLLEKSLEDVWKYRKKKDCHLRHLKNY